MVSRSDLIKYISDKTLITVIDAKIIVKVLFKGLIKELCENENRINIRGFGTFYIQKRKARTAINPKTQEIISVPAKKVIKFIPSKKILDIINK